MTYHSFNTTIAKEYGIEEAILLDNIYFWEKKNIANKQNFHHGKYWTYNSVKAFNELFDYITPSKISRALKNLEDFGLIETGVFNTNKYNHTKWYRTTDFAKSFFQNDKSILQNEKSNNQNDESIVTKTQTNITDYKPNNKQQIKETDIGEASSSESVVYNSNFSRANLINSECFEETGNCFREVHEIWVKNELPLSRASHDFFTFSCRELKNALGLWSGKGVHEAELFEALDNYIQVAKLIKEGGSWMETVGGFEFFAKHIFDFVEGSFDINKYKRSKTAVNIGQKEKVDINKILAEMGEL